MTNRPTSAALRYLSPRGEALITLGPDDPGRLVLTDLTGSLDRAVPLQALPGPVSNHCAVDEVFPAGSYEVVVEQVDRVGYLGASVIAWIASAILQEDSGSMAPEKMYKVYVRQVGASGGKLWSEECKGSAVFGLAKEMADQVKSAGIEDFIAKKRTRRTD